MIAADSIIGCRMLVRRRRRCYLCGDLIPKKSQLNVYEAVQATCTSHTSIFSSSLTLHWQVASAPVEMLAVAQMTPSRCTIAAPARTDADIHTDPELAVSIPLLSIRLVPHSVHFCDTRYRTPHTENRCQLAKLRNKIVFQTRRIT